MKKPNRTVKATAASIILNALAYADETGREITQFRLKDSTTRKISRRTHLNDSFRRKLLVELAGMGWALVWPYQECMGFIKMERVQNFTQLSSKRLGLNADAFPDADTPFRAAVLEVLNEDGTSSLLDLDDELLIDLCQKLSGKNEDPAQEE